MATIATLTVRIEADNTRFLKSMKKSEKALNGFAQGALGSMNVIGGSIIKVGAVMGAAAIAGTVAFTAASIKMAADFDAAMRNVNAIAQLPEEQFQNLKERVIDFSLTTRASAGDIAKALYNVVSAGFAIEDAFIVMKASSRAAGAGLAQTEDTSRLLIAAMRSYGFGVEDVEMITDIFLQTVNEGLTTLPALASVLGRVFAISSKVGVGLDEVSFSMARATQTGLSSEDAATRLMQLYTQFLKPSTELKKAMDELGYASGTQMIKQLGGVLPALKLLRDRGYADTSDKVAALFGNVRALQGALALMGDESTMAAGAVEEFGKRAAGAVERAREQQYKSLTAQIAKLKGAVEAIMIAFGDPFIDPLVRLIKEGLFPLAVTVGKKVMKFMKNFKIALKGGVDPVMAFRVALSGVIPSDIFKKIDEIILKIQDFALALTDFMRNALIPFVKEHGPALKAIILAIGGVLAASVLVAVLTFIGGLIAGLVSPIGLVFVAIAALAAAWATNWGGIRDKVAEVVAFMEPIIQNVIAWFQENIPLALAAVAEFWEAKLKPAFTAIAAFITEKLVPAIQTLIAWFKENLLPIIKSVADFVMTVLRLEFEILAGIFRNIVVPAIKAVVQFLEEHFLPGFMLVWQFIKEKLGPIFMWLVDNVFESMKIGLRGVKTLVDGFRKALDLVTGALKDIKLPDWLIGKSPTPLEIGLRGITGAMSQLNRTELPRLEARLGRLQMQPLAAMGGVGGGGEGVTQYNDLTIHSNAQTEQVADSYEILRSLART